jgi:glycine/D-amino acid oxidase-like deaminating enzyme
VTLIDRGDVGREASMANAGTMAIQNKHHWNVPAALLSVQRWSELQEDLGLDVRFEQRGGLCVANDEKDFARLKLQVESQRQQGVPLEIVTGSDLRSLAPYLGSATAASYCPLDSMSDPLRAAAAFSAKAIELGARIFTHDPVIDIQPLSDGTWITRTANQRRVTSGAIVLATGAWTAKLTRPLGFDIKVGCLIQTVSITESSPFFIPHILTHVQRNLTIKQFRSSGQVLIGGGWLGRGDIDTDTKDVDPDTLSANLRHASKTVSGLRGLRLLRAWCGFEGSSPDRVPLLGQLPGHDTAYVVACAEGGYTLGPYLGREIASWLLHGPPSADSPAASFNVRRLQATSTAA